MVNGLPKNQFINISSHFGLTRGNDDFCFILFLCVFGFLEAEVYSSVNKDNFSGNLICSVDFLPTEAAHTL